MADTAVRIARRAAIAVAISGIVALATDVAFRAGAGAGFGTLSDLALVAMTVALVPVMAGYFELGGRTPLRPAQASLALGVAAVATWCGIEALAIAGFVTLDPDSPAQGAGAVQAVALAIVGLWLAGANLLAGPWLGIPARVLGVVAGVGTVVFAAGLLQGGAADPLAAAGAVGYQVALPLWAAALVVGWGTVSRAWSRARARARPGRR